MSRYPPSDYRGPRDRSRSPPRFVDRRNSSAAAFDSRPPGPPRTASEAPRGPRTQLDGARPPLNNTVGPPGIPRPGYASLRDAPPLGSGDRGRPYREREYDRRERPPSPRDRSLPRNVKDARDPPPRELDLIRSRRESRDGPLPPNSAYADSQHISPAPSARGAPLRGRGRGDFGFRGGRGGRANADERDLFNRERSPPPRWPTELPRDNREPDRRDDRRFERREDDRRPSDWSDRERERDVDRGRRDQPPPRFESRPSIDSAPGTGGSLPPAQASQVNPARLALIESAASDLGPRRASVQQDVAPPRDGRRDVSDSSAYLNARAETTANRYGSGGSSPPTQAPPVPAFTLSFAPTPNSTAAPQQPITSSQPSKPILQSKPSTTTLTSTAQNVAQAPKPAERQDARPPMEAPSAPRLPPAAPKAQLVNAPPGAPRAPRALESEDSAAASNRLHGVRSLESISAPTGPANLRPDGNGPFRPVSNSASPATVPTIPVLARQPSPATQLMPPSGPRAARVLPAQAAISPRPSFASPRPDTTRPVGIPRAQTPPPSAPSGPRKPSFSVSPRVANSAVPTAPKANRGPPVAPRALERVLPPSSAHVADRPAAPSTWGAPAAPRAQAVWNQWKRPGAQQHVDKTVPTKRDIMGETKPRPTNTAMASSAVAHDVAASRNDSRDINGMDIDSQPPRRQSTMMSGHSAARSFFGKPTQGENEDSAVSDTAQEPLSTSESEDSDLENDLALFNAKFERQKRQLESQKVDLSKRDYRATTPLENLARLARITVKDLERYQEQRQHDMDVDQSPVERNPRLPPTRQSSDSGEAPDVVTPQDDVDRHVDIRSSEESSDGIRRARRPSPEPVHLPYLPKGAGRHAPLKLEIGQNSEEIHAGLLDALTEDFEERQNERLALEDGFAYQYRRWREECEELDRLKEEQDKLERQQSFEPKPEMELPTAAPTAPILEGRRLHKFSSEYEIEQVLKQSEETARVEQERADREQRKNQADMEKEAVVPDQMTDSEIARGVFLDTNRYRDPASLTMVFSYQPPPDDFTENEQHIFIAAYKETPKKWGEIASLLPGRSYSDCIRHYYANKWDGRFRDHRSKKLKMGGKRGGGRGRGPRGRMGGLMADLRVEDFPAEMMNEKGRPRRAAAPITFAEKEVEAKAILAGQSPAKKPGPGSKADANGEAGTEKPGKRQKRNGEKAPRKSNKSTQPLAALAAAPQESPGKQYIDAAHSKEDLADASLLASFHTSSHPCALHHDGHLVYREESFMPHMSVMAEDHERPRAVGQGQPAKQGASSYWSVPEQNDFVKYIAHFGRDFAAIAHHMGTKTQTMIKNHYQRQVDGGSRQELEASALMADDRRARGEDIGLPPTPTPIQKRKYENPPAPAQRALAPHGESAEMEDGMPVRMQVAKHGSPPQYQPQPGFTTSMQHGVSSVSRVMHSPLVATAETTDPLSNASSRPVQHPFGSRITFLPDSRSETRPSVQPMSGYRQGQESPKHPQRMPPSIQPVSEANNASFLRNLAQQQQDALRKERQISHSDRIGSFQPRSNISQNPSQRSPLSQSQHLPQDRKTIVEERPLSPPGGRFIPSALHRSIFGNSSIPSLHSTSMSPVTGRSAYEISPLKREEPRPDAFMPAPTQHLPTAPAPPSEPKRVNVMSLLNSEPEAPKPPKRESLPSMGFRNPSPAQQGFPPTTSGTPMSGISAQRRESSFGQPPLPQSQVGRESLRQHSANSSAASFGLKRVPSPASATSSQPFKTDWTSRIGSQPTQSSPQEPPLDRDGRSYLHHRGMLGSLGTRFNPSPPPLPTNAHSRTPSLSTPINQQMREQPRTAMPGQGPMPALQSNPYATQSQTPYSHQQQVPSTQSQAHHSRTNTPSGPFPTFRPRTTGVDDHARQDQPLGTAQRDRDEPDARWRQHTFEPERRRDDPWAQRQQQEQERERERERERQQAQQQRQPPPPSQPPTYGAGPFGQGRNLDLRSQSRIESEMAMREEQERQRLQQDGDRRRQEEMVRQREMDERRRLEEPAYFRRTLQGGVFGTTPTAPRR